MIFTLFLSILTPACFAKVLEFVNDSNIYMSFQFANYACMNIVPDKFELLPNQSSKIQINIDMENKNRCPDGQNFPVFKLVGWASKYPGMKSSFGYQALFQDHPLSDEWKCESQNDEGLFPFYCYYINSNSHPDFELTADNSKIHITSSPEPTNKGFYTFWNDTDDKFYSLKFPRGCLSNRIGSFQPKSKNNLPDSLIQNNCSNSKTSCEISVHIGKDCSKPPIGTISLNINKGVEWTKLLPSEEDYAYRINYEQSAYGQDIHVAKTIHYAIWNSTYDVLNMNIAGSCVISKANNSLLYPNGIHPLPSNLWNYCKELPCPINISKTVKTNNEYSCGPLVGTVVLDIDRGVKSIHIEPTSQYQLSFNTAKPNISQEIYIVKK